MTARTKTLRPPKITPELQDAVKTLILAQAYRQTVEPVVTAYQTAILTRHGFHIAPEWLERRHAAEDRIITNPRDAYLLSDEDSAVIYAEYDQAAIAAGFTDLEPGYCPLLVAENLERQAENAVIEAAEYVAGLKLEHANGVLFKHRGEIIANTVSLVFALTGMTAADILASTR